VALRSLVRGAVERVMCALPRRTRPGDRLILAYHNVVPSDWEPRGDRSLHLSIDRFEEQLRLIREQAEIVPLMELLTTAAPRERRVAITFDDAYASALTLAVPACAAAEAPCTIFVAPALLGTIPHWDWAADAGAWSGADRERFLWQQSGVPAHGQGDLALSSCAELRIAEYAQLRAAASSALVTIGNHTMRHPNLGALPEDAASDDIEEADRWLRQRFPSQYVPVLAYPFGLARSPMDAARWTTTIDYALRVTGGWSPTATPPGRLQIPRWNVPAGISRHGFQLRLRGRLGSRP
jgi:peptidoglycan/xylan/chitin deacetylase (PgdA/CDA1 family)